MFLTFSEPLLKTSYHEFKAFKEWTLPPKRSPKLPPPPQSHPLAIVLLEHFAHVFLEDIPLGLPPKTSIQHHIDLIIEAILPNKPAYMMNPKETIEVQR